MFGSEVLHRTYPKIRSITQKLGIVDQNIPLFIIFPYNIAFSKAINECLMIFSKVFVRSLLILYMFGREVLHRTYPKIRSIPQKLGIGDQNIPFFIIFHII